MRLIEPNVREVSYVDRPASGKRFAIVKAEDGTAQFETFVSIHKAEDGVVSGIAYYAGSEEDADLQGDWTDAEGVRQMEKTWRENGSKLFFMHREPATGSFVVESRILKNAERHGNQLVPAGSWLLTTRPRSDVYDAIRAGDLTGYSIGGSARTMKTASEDNAIRSDRFFQPDNGIEIRIDGVELTTKTAELHDAEEARELAQLALDVSLVAEALEDKALAVRALELATNCATIVNDKLNKE